MNERPPKVVVTKIGFDGHDRGSRVVAAALRDAGMEVVYTPPWQDIAAVVKLALEEDVDVIGISSLASDHLLVPKLMAAMRDAQIDDIAALCRRATRSCSWRRASHACSTQARRSTTS